ncbi:MAG: hypothetical protein AAB438_02365 [Patescibacteria group bacterium]
MKNALALFFFCLLFTQVNAQINEVNTRNLARFVKTYPDSTIKTTQGYVYTLFYPESGLKAKATFANDSTITTLSIVSSKGGAESLWTVNLFNQNANVYRNIPAIKYSSDSLRQKEVRILNGMIGLLRETKSLENLRLQRHSRTLLLGQVDTLLQNAKNEADCYELSQLSIWKELGVKTSYGRQNTYWVFRIDTPPSKNSDFRKIQEILEKRFPKK